MSATWADCFASSEATTRSMISPEIRIEQGSKHDDPAPPRRLPGDGLRGIDPVTGRQRQIARQVRASARPSAWRPGCAPRLPTAATAAPAPARSGSCWTSTSAGQRPAASPSPSPPSTTTAPSSRPSSSRPSASCDSPARPGHPGPLLRPVAPPGPQRQCVTQHQPDPAGPRRAVRRPGPGRPLRVDQLQSVACPPGAAQIAAGAVDDTLAAINQVAQILCGGTVGLAHANSPHAHGQPVSVAGLYLIMSCPGDSGDIR